ncbi:MAG TPA: hypothetical protein VKK31_31365 [Thermoanaerobaculia bacterium]|nr:hypothetical protein [Thermoanaerobaculia bacterium]
MKRSLSSLALLLVLSTPVFAQAPETGAAQVSAAPGRIVYHLEKSLLPRKGRSVVELELLRGGERFLMESHEVARRGTETTMRIELAAQSPEVRQELLALDRAELPGTLVLVVRLDGREIERLPFHDVIGYDRLLRREASVPARKSLAPPSQLGSISAAETVQDCENRCNTNYNTCIFTTPSCQGMDWCPQCEDQLNSCLGGCIACQTDYCLTCGLPFTWTDDDADTVPDRLEYSLAHQFFPNILLQHFDKDLQPSYFYNNWTVPFTVNRVTQGFCDQDKECLEIRYGTAYKEDYGDNILGISGHHGDGEFYAALVQRTTDWTTASTSATYWQMVRDFTAAHWNTSGDSSRYGAYGKCPVICSSYNSNEQGCTANSKWCSWQRSLCYGIADYQNLPCINHWEQEDCRASGCSWKASSCVAPVRIACDSTTPVTVAPTFYAAERKHGVYHTDQECEQGGLFSADTCPYNQYNLRSYKGQKLQNVGTETWHSDSIIYSPGGCSLYDVWSGNEFGGSNSNYRAAFRYQFNWDIPIIPFSPIGGPTF